MQKAGMEVQSRFEPIQDDYAISSERRCDQTHKIEPLETTETKTSKK